MGIDAFDAMLPSEADERRSVLARLAAPSTDAPVLLPAHIDLLAQTAPRPSVVPDPALFLHGPRREAPEAYVVWRADLEAGDVDTRWLDIISLLPPASVEALAVPLWRLRRWLSGRPLDGEAGGDVEGVGAAREMPEPRSNQAPAQSSSARAPRFMVWRGRDRSRVVNDADDIRPGDIVMVPADEEFADRLGASFQRPNDGKARASLDALERGWPGARGRHVLRLNGAVLRAWHEFESVKKLLSWAEQEEPDEALLPGLLAAVAESRPETSGEGVASELPEWLTGSAQTLASSRARGAVRRHPGGGLIVYGRAGVVGQPDEFSFADEDDTLSEADEPVGLAEHLAAVESAARGFATRCIEPSLVEHVVTAAGVHDLGKLDERFQALLLGGPLAAAAAAEPVAKSASIPTSRSLRHAIRAASGLPDGFRHEMLSLQLATIAGFLADDAVGRELASHLIASHHGHGRPFAPVCHDFDPPGVAGTAGNLQISFDQADRSAGLPAHRVDSGIADAFWSLVRRFGWWGLAYLEAMVRLADWRASTSTPVAGDEVTRASKEAAA
jgi:CRISPR-associated endonuclease/helicase Cas3